MAKPVVLPSESSRHTGDVFKQVLANVLEERVHRIRTYVEQDKAVSRDELARFVWGTGRKVFEVIAPSAKEGDSKRMQAWRDAKGMLKELIDWDKFTHAQFHDICIYNVLEKKVVDVLDAYRTFVLTGEIKTKHPPPKLLGETDEILCVDKPCLYTCSYGERLGTPPGRALKRLGEKASASMLLNGEKAEIQLHEYLALKYNYENAAGTREFWKEEPDLMACSCGSCGYCACTQSGCCNRLDKETSGVLIAAKTKAGFPEIRRQFASEHSLEEGGTEKYYLCLVHGEVKLPAKEDDRNSFWKHSVVNGRGRIEVTLVFDKSVWKSLPHDDGKERNGPGCENSEGKEVTAPQYALTFYEPVAWFEYGSGGEKFTLCHLQIITGRTHQIRFHMQQVGHPLVGDTTYGAPFSDRAWCPRVFLHSYQTKFREPFTDRWFEATSPLPQDLGEVIQNNLGAPLRTKEGAQFLSRRVHEVLHSFLGQYNPAKPLLFSHDAPVNKEEVMRRVAMQQAQAAAYAKQSAGGAGAPGQQWQAQQAPQATQAAWSGEVTYNSKGYPVRPGGVPCAFYMKTGECKFGATCKFTHPEDRTAPLAPPAVVVPPPAVAATAKTANGDAWQSWQADKGDGSWQTNKGDGNWQADKGDGSWQADKAGASWKADDGKNGWDSGGAANSWQADKGGNSWQAGGDWNANGAWKGSSNGGWQGSSWESASWDKGGASGGAKWEAGGSPQKSEQKPSNNEEDEEDSWGGWSGEKEPAAKRARTDEGPAKPKPPSQPLKPLLPLTTAPPAAAPAAAAPVAAAPVAAAAPHLAPVAEKPAAAAPAVAAAPAPAAAAPAPAAAAGAGAGASGWKRMESRSQPGVFYYWNQQSGETQAEPPAPWEKRQSRSQPGVWYYWNPNTGATSPQKPEL